LRFPRYPRVSLCLTKVSGTANLLSAFSQLAPLPLNRRRLPPSSLRAYNFFFFSTCFQILNLRIRSRALAIATVFLSSVPPCTVTEIPHFRPRRQVSPPTLISFFFLAPLGCCDLCRVLLPHPQACFAAASPSLSGNEGSSFSYSGAKTRIVFDECILYVLSACCGL